MRSSRDWVDNRWVDVMSKPDILRHLSADAVSSIKFEAPGCDTAASLECKFVKTSRLEAIEEDVPGSSVSGDPKIVKEVYSIQMPGVNVKDKLKTHGAVDDVGGDCDHEEKANNVVTAAYVDNGGEDSSGNNTEFLVDKDLKSVDKISEAAKAL